MAEAFAKTSSGTPSDPVAYRTVMRRLRPALAAAALFSAVISVLMLTGSLYMLQVYDRVLSSGSVPTLLGLFAIVVLAYAFLGTYDLLRARLLARIGLRLDLALTEAAYRRMLEGDPAGRPALAQIATLRRFFSSPAITGLFDLPFVPLFLCVLALVHPWLGLLTLAGAGVAAVLALTSRWLTRAPLAAGQAAEAAETAFTEKLAQGSELIRAYGMAEDMTRLWQRHHRAALAAHQGATAPTEVIGAGSRSFRMLLQSAILTLGALLVLRQEMTAGMIVAASILSGRALAPIDQIIAHWRSIALARNAHRRLAETFPVADAAEPRSAPMGLPAPSGRISLDRVTVLDPNSRGMDRRRLLSQISLELEPGAGLGVIGASAAGKSTLARLLVGAITPDLGEIRLDGATPGQWSPRALGRAIGYLPQQVQMLPGTVRDNISRFTEDATDEAVIAAAKLAGVHEMILELPQGYATRLGDGAPAPLSGGQLQRIALARAVFGKPRILVLDEPNSNLDGAGEDALTAAIARLRADGSTVIVMAHRPSALVAVDRILVLHRGHVVRDGSKYEILGPVRAGDAAQAAPAMAAAAPSKAPPPPETTPRPAATDPGKEQMRIVSTTAMSSPRPVPMRRPGATASETMTSSEPQAWPWPASIAEAFADVAGHRAATSSETPVNIGSNGDSKKDSAADETARQPTPGHAAAPLQALLDDRRRTANGGTLQ